VDGHGEKTVKRFRLKICDKRKATIDLARAAWVNRPPHPGQGECRIVDVHGAGGEGQRAAVEPQKKLQAMMKKNAVAAILRETSGRGIGMSGNPIQE